MTPMLIESTIRSQFLGNDRQVWFQPSPKNRPAQALCVLLDGEYYVDRMDAPSVLAALQTSHDFPAFSVAYVSHVDGPTRWQECCCNEHFAKFVSTELLPWLESTFSQEAPSPVIILGGLSLTGLAAAHTALLHPEKFFGVLCQSASFWWSDNWLVQECGKRPRTNLRFRMSCGSQETTEYLEHGPNLIQRTSQLAANRAMRDVLKNLCRSVSYEEFTGGHDIASWRSDLPRSFTALLADVGTVNSGDGTAKANCSEFENISDQFT
jgi:enterochelin esterase-like enzyme